MEFCKKILDWALLIAKIIFTIVLIIIGIRLIAFLLAPHFLISIPVFSFTIFDWNPLATIFGAVLTGLITWFAIYKTAEFDKKARKFEYRNKFYQDKLLELNDCIGWIEILNERGFNQDIKTPFLLNEKYLYVMETKLQEFKKILNYIILLKPNSCFEEFKKNELPSVEAFFSFLKDNPNTKFYDGNCKNKFKEYIQNENSKDMDEPVFENINYANKKEKIELIKNEIKKEFKLDEK